MMLSQESDPTERSNARFLQEQGVNAGKMNAG